VIGFNYEVNRQTRYAQKCRPAKLCPHNVPHITDYTKFLDPIGTDTLFLPTNEDCTTGYTINKHYDQQLHTYIAASLPELQTSYQGTTINIASKVGADKDVKPFDGANTYLGPYYHLADRPVIPLIVSEDKSSSGQQH